MIMMYDEHRHDDETDKENTKTFRAYFSLCAVKGNLPWVVLKCIFLVGS